MNNLTLISDHVLIPHQADWTSVPKLSRIWRGGVDTALSGAEDRLTVRDVAWMKLEYLVAPFDQVERYRFQTRMEAALKIGRAAVPHFGKGVALGSNAHAAQPSVVLARSDHGFAVGTFVLVQSSVRSDFDTWDVSLIDSVDGATINLSEDLGSSYESNVARVWPLLFGKPSSDQFRVMNRARAAYPVSIQFEGQELSAASSEDFQDYPVGDVEGLLAGGTGWAGPWHFSQFSV